MAKLVTPVSLDHAFLEGCNHLRSHGVLYDSRNGLVRVLDSPFITEYKYPQRCILFNPIRDANPFFHFFEALWMLAGRRDVKFVSIFNSKIHKYSDDGRVFHAAYGYRWRSWFQQDQLNSIITSLRADPYCRRQVLTMWDPKSDLGKEGLDFPCNTQAYFQINPSTGGLDMMVTNRSNDLIWGAYGANAVHFSFLLQFMAMGIGVPVGRYTQVSMNTHYYVEQHQDLVDAVCTAESFRSPYLKIQVNPLPFIQGDETFDDWQEDLEVFFSQHGKYKTIFFTQVVVPMLNGWTVYKDKDLNGSIARLERIKASDWKRATTQWIYRRRRRTGTARYE